MGIVAPTMQGASNSQFLMNQMSLASNAPNSTQFMSATEQLAASALQQQGFFNPQHQVVQQYGAQMPTQAQMAAQNYGLMQAVQGQNGG